MVFLRKGPVGHIGWAFECGDGTWNVGAVENPGHGFHTSASRMGWWSETVPDPVSTMRERNYDDYKLVEVHNPHVSSAQQKAQAVRRHSFNMVNHNCEDDAYEVLTAFGACLPYPGHPQNWTPMAWFHHIRGKSAPLEEAPDLR